MKTFSMALKNIKNVTPVKIAIIDDGVDTTWPEVHGKVVKGKSFYPYANSTEYYHDYFVPSGKHGTHMASLICKICPRPQLYIARMEERQVEGDAARFTTESAIKVREIYVPSKSLFIKFTNISLW